MSILFKLKSCCISTEGIKAYKNMLESILPLHTPSTPGVGSKGLFDSFLKVVMLHIKLTGMKYRTPCKQLFCLFIHARSLGVAKGQNNYFLKVFVLDFKLKGKTCRKTCKQTV